MDRPPSVPLSPAFALVALALAFTPLIVPPLPAQTPVGSEFRVNTYTPSVQQLPDLAVDPAGNFVVVWESRNQDGDDLGVFLRRFDSSGIAFGNEVQVNTYTSGDQDSAAVAVAADGSFVVVWKSSGQDGSADGIFARRYSSTGAPLGGEFQVNSHATGYQLYPDVAIAADRTFVVVWDTVADGSDVGIAARRFASNGTPLGGELAVNTYTSSTQARASVATDAAGNFVVVWQSGPGLFTGVEQDGSGHGVFGRRFSSAGVPLAGEFRVNIETQYDQQAPAVAAIAAGAFVVTWQSELLDGGGQGIFGRRFDAAGNGLGTEFLVNSHITGDQELPSIALDAAGEFVITWESGGQDGSSEGVIARRYSSSGLRLGSEFVVNSYTSSLQYRPAVGARPNSDFVVAWQSRGQDGSGNSVHAQRFAPAAVPLCPPGTLCLSDNRFHVTVEWETPQGASGVGQPVALTNDTGYFWFFSESNVEMVIKTLNGCGVNQHFWVFAGGLTNVEVRITVIDNLTGQLRSYVNPQGTRFQPIQDTTAFPTCGVGVSEPQDPAIMAGALDPESVAADVASVLAAMAPPAAADGAAPITAALTAACAPNATTLCLNNGRFEVRTAWRTPQGQSGAGQAVTLTADTGYFWFFNPSNVEMILKVLNGCPVNARYWVFAGGLTNVEVTMTVRDASNDQVRTYVNPLNTAFAPIQDTGAFETCP